MNKENKTLYEYLSEYRSELMGLAILWVVWYHSSLELDVFPSETINNILIFIRGRGYGGVDIFLLLSGMGLYNSLSRNSVAKYLKNRLKRILPTWWILYLVTAVLEFKLLDIHYSAKELLGGITLTGFLTQLPNQGNWYVSFIMVIYIIAPVLYFLFHESKNKRATCIILVAITLLMSVTFWGDDGRLTGMTRLPIFVFGMYLSADRDKIKVNRTTIIVLSALMAIGIALLRVCQGIDWDTRWHYGLWWYPFILVTPGLAMLLSMIIGKTAGILKLLNRMLKSCGLASLELLIISEFVIEHNGELIDYTISKRLFEFVSIVICALLAVMFHYLVDRVMELLLYHFHQTS